MEFILDQAFPILERTPGVLRALLDGLPETWIMCDEGPETWSVFDVLGHLIHGERTDWMPRLRIILEYGSDRAFEPFDRFAQLQENQGKSLRELLDVFQELRQDSLHSLRGLALQPADYERRGTHPELGEVTLGQLLATWVVHDLNHINQISAVMARQYDHEVGLWKTYLPILQV
jgi:uncharacterized damage-inducible protein DinB